MRSIKAEGIVAERWRKGGLLTAQALGTQARVTLIVVELCDEALEAAPERPDFG